MTQSSSRVPLLVSFVAAILCASMLNAARTNDRDRDKPRPEAGPVATAPERELSDTEQGCVDGRVKDYFRRHSDRGVIDPFTMLELSRDMQRTMEQEQRIRTISSIPGTTWTSLGPTNGAGRAGAIAVDPTTPTTLIIGTAGGGAWKTTDSGTSWTALTDAIPNLSIGAVAYAPSSPSTIYLGTGEGVYSGDAIPGIGLLASADGGANWSLPTSVIATTIYKISVHPTNPSELVIATGSGAFRSTGGQNGPWSTVISRDSGVSTTGYGDIADLVRDPSNPLILYAATWDSNWCARYGPCFNPYNTVGSTVLKSIDGGQTWNPANTGLPVTTATSHVSRIAIAIGGPSSPSTLYAATSIFNTAGASVSHIYKTTNGGGSWTETTLSSNADARISHYHTGAGDQVSYDNTIVVSPADPNVVIAGGVYYVRSIDGGTTWSRGFATGVGVHVDVHDLHYAGSVLFVANDGGIYSSADNGVTGTALNTGLVTRQYYTLTNDPANRNRIFGGMQDNGSNRRPDAGGTAWDTMTGGDGFGCTVIPTVPSIAFTSYQYEALNRTMGGGDATPLFSNASPAFPSTESVPFATTIVNDPGSPQTLYTAGLRLWKSTDAGESWIPLPTTTTDASTWDMTQGHEIASIAVSKSNPSILMVAKGYDYSAYHPLIYRSTNGGTTWVLANASLPTGRYPTYVEIDPANPNNAYVTFAGVSGNALYKTINGGVSWTVSATGLPNFSAQVVRVDPTDSNTLYCGTDVGVYRSVDGGANWSRFGTGMPAVSVYDVRALYDGSILRAATHGRGMWEFNITGVTNHPPTASITTPGSPSTATKGSPVSFSGSVADIDGGDSATALWTFPDDWSSVSGTSTSHTFNRAGIFPVTLLATDTHGATGAATAKVTVMESGDACSAPVTIPALGPFPWSTSLTTAAASVQASDPGSTGGNPAGSCYPYSPNATVWFSFTPATSGTYSFYTCGSKSSTVIELWTGALCGPYTAVASGCLVNTSPISDCSTDTKLSLSLTGGTTYRIMLSAYYYRDDGPMTLTVTSGTTIGTTVSAISPSSGTSAGGSPVVISGSGFVSGASVTIGGAAATAVNVISPSILTATTAAHAAGVTDVAVTSATTTGTLGSAFTYLNTIVLAAPANLVATATSTSQAGLTWAAVTNANHYEVVRSSNNGPFSTTGTPAGTSFNDTGLTGGITYVYKVRAIGPSGETSPYSNIDVATTIMFTNDPLQVNVTPIQVGHFTEARAAVAAMRLSAGLGVFTFTDNTLTGMPVKAVHMLELRSALDAARAAFSLPAMTYTNAIVAPTSVVQAIDLTEIRNGVK